DGAGVGAEEPYPFAHDHRDDVHRYLVDEAGRERLSADVAGGHADQAVAGDFLGQSDAGLDRVGDVERRVGEPGEPFLGQRPVGDDDELVPGGGYARPAVGGVEQVAADHRDLDGVAKPLHVVGGGA